MRRVCHALRKESELGAKREGRERNRVREKEEEKKKERRKERKLYIQPYNK